jgi:hypothetical protein
MRQSELILRELVRVYRQKATTQSAKATEYGREVAQETADAIEELIELRKRAISIPVEGVVS